MRTEDNFDREMSIQTEKYIKIKTSGDREILIQTKVNNETIWKRKRNINTDRREH